MPLDNLTPEMQNSQKTRELEERIDSLEKRIRRLENSKVKPEAKKKPGARAKEKAK
jgi:chaperonin cofactor prefoldin